MNTRTSSQCKNIWEFQENYFMTESVRIIKWYWHDIKTTINSSTWKSFECHHSKCILKSTSRFPPWCSSSLTSKVKQLSLNEQLLLVKNFLIDNNFVKVTTSRDKVFSCCRVSVWKLLEFQHNNSTQEYPRQQLPPLQIKFCQTRWDERVGEIKYFCFFVSIFCATV